MLTYYNLQRMTRQRADSLDEKRASSADDASVFLQRKRCDTPRKAKVKGVFAWIPNAFASNGGKSALRYRILSLL